MAKIKHANIVVSVNMDVNMDEMFSMDNLDELVFDLIGVSYHANKARKELHKFYSVYNKLAFNGYKEGFKHLEPLVYHLGFRLKKLLDKLDDNTMLVLDRYNKTIKNSVFNGINIKHYIRSVESTFPEIPKILEGTVDRDSQLGLLYEIILGEFILLILADLKKIKMKIVDLYTIDDVKEQHDRIELLLKRCNRLYKKVSSLNKIKADADINRVSDAKVELERILIMS